MVAVLLIKPQVKLRLLSNDKYHGTNNYISNFYFILLFICKRK